MRKNESVHRTFEIGKDALLYTSACNGVHITAYDKINM